MYEDSIEENDVRKSLPEAIALFDASWRSTTSTCIGAALEEASKRTIIRAIINTILNASALCKEDIRGAINVYRVTAMRYGASERRLAQMMSQLDNEQNILMSRYKRFQVLRHAFDDLLVILINEANMMGIEEEMDYFLVYHYATEPFYTPQRGVRTDSWQFLPVSPECTRPLAYSRSKARAPNSCTQWQRDDTAGLPFLTTLNTRAVSSPKVTNDTIQVCAVHGNIHVHTTPTSAPYDGVYTQDITIQSVRTSTSGRPYYRRTRPLKQSEIDSLEVDLHENSFFHASQSPPRLKHRPSSHNKRRPFHLINNRLPFFQRKSPRQPNSASCDQPDSDE